MQPVSTYKAIEKDAYRITARFYDRLFESMNKGLRLVGIRMFRPKAEMSILDIGCGTGTHLELYKRFGCKLFGLDASPSMLELAKKRLGNEAQLALGDAADLFYESNQFNLIVTMLILHEMSPTKRFAAIEEMKRVLKPDGRLLWIDFQPGPYQPLQGWISKIIILMSEFSAGRTHFTNYKNFLSNHGLKTLINQHNLVIQNERILAGGTFANYLLSK